jgi:hypothetical protein
LVKKSFTKYKLLSFDELVISLDRLSRFKLPEDSYTRVFHSIILKCLISPKFSKEELEELDTKIISNFVKEIWNNSVKSLNIKCTKSMTLNTVMQPLIENTFKNTDKSIKTLVNTQLEITPILKKIDYEQSVFNLKFLMKVQEKFEKNPKINYEELTRLRDKYSLMLPVSKILIVEGITEEILLPVFSKKLGLNFDKMGIYILGAGGKSKSPSLYFKLKNKLKIPIILLFDLDANEICLQLKEALNKKDKTIIIENGEFEDILSLTLLKRSLNKEYLPATPVIMQDLRIFHSMCENIEYFYKSRKLGEFKKSKLSKIIAKNIKYNSDITPQIKKLIHNII